MPGEPVVMGREAQRAVVDAESGRVQFRPPGNLPIQASSFIGRERELDELEGMLASSRLLTLTGPGGCGKTRLALQTASHVADRFEDGVGFAELASLSATDPEWVTPEHEVRPVRPSATQRALRNRLV